MKHINKNLIYPLIAISITLFVINSCKKDELDKEMNLEILFNPDKTYGTVSDNEGNEYKTIVIGTQTWMAENLRSIKYRNGDEIDTTSFPWLDISLQDEPKYQWPAGNDESLVKIYGRLYTWYTATDERGICPEGWHVPTLGEWDILVDYIGDWRYGGKLKETGNRHWHWHESNTYVTNETGFTALPSGDRDSLGRFFSPGYYASWWLATEYSHGFGYSGSLHYSDNWVTDGFSYKKSAFSVRCLKD